MLVSAKPSGIFRGGVRVRGSATHFSRPTPTPHSRIDSGRHTLLPIGLGLCRIAVVAFEDVPSTPSRETPASKRHSPLDGIILMVSAR
jgi:hypothetical protein